MQVEDYEVIVEGLTRFICSGDSIQAPDPSSLTPTTNLIDDGIVDSLGLFSIISFLEERFGFAVSNDDVVAENFASVDAIARYVMRRAEGSP